MTKKIELIGVYDVKENKNVYLVELGIKTNHENVVINKFTQAIDGKDRLDWQTPWDEKFLNIEGTRITGDYMDSPTDTSNFTRLVFFFHFLDFDKPLLTQYGELELSNPEKVPERISSIIEYQKP
ncbi:MAG: hypothetical protein MK202_02135 [Tenacibaculum sp.]|nr:hypothetical protein [Tenacibaculum sp.]